MTRISIDCGQGIGVIEVDRLYWVADRGEWYAYGRRFVSYGIHEGEGFTGHGATMELALGQLKTALIGSLQSSTD